MRRSTSGLEAWERKLPNWALQSHGTGDSRKGLVAHSGAKLAASDRDDENETRTKGNGSEMKEIW